MRLSTATLFAFVTCVAAQTPAPDGQKLYAKNCSSCHGDNADGTDQGPRLAGNRRLRSRNTQQIRKIIYDGNISGGMPPFHLPDPELDALASVVRSMNTAAAEAAVPGDLAAGEAFFFGIGHCDGCHMVRGRGKPTGPDLSNIGRELTVGELRQSLLQPDQAITSGYSLMTVQLRDGKRIRGFARGRTNFDIQLQSLDGRLHGFRQDEVASIADEKHSLMKPVNASADELRDLMAYLSRLTGVERNAPLKASAPTENGDVDFSRLVHPQKGDWLSYNGTIDGNRYSALDQINRSNVGGLTVRWMYPVDHFGLEVTPLVVDGIMYITGPNQAFALDAKTGREIWRYGQPRTPGLIGDASLGTNRGLAILGDKLYMVTDNAHLLAINRISGSLIWDIKMPLEPMHYGSTVTPFIVKDTVIAGVSGGDRGMRGFLVCYKAGTGELLWRKWTIPFKGDKGRETWGPKEPIEGGGATWLTGAYDPDSDTLYWPTGNPYPDSDDRDRPGDNLYTNCILAMDPKTGDIKWYFQFTPHDVHDWDANEPPILADTLFQGRQRKLLLHADRNGFFYVFDRRDGKLLLTKQFIQRQTWTSGIGADGRPLPPEKPSALDCPTDAANWNSATFSPVTRLMYVLVHEGCRARRLKGSWNAEPEVEPPQKFLRAIEIDSGKIAWEIPFIGPVIPKSWPGVVGTAGGLLFYGDPNGAFAAADERTGKTLWHMPTNVLMKGSPMTYMAGGEQFVAIAAGPNVISFALPRSK